MANHCLNSHLQVLECPGNELNSKKKVFRTYILRNFYSLYCLRGNQIAFKFFTGDKMHFSTQTSRRLIDEISPESLNFII